MLRLFLALNFLLLNLYACQGGFEACRLKVKHSQSILNNTLQVSVLKNKRLIYSTKTPNKKILKYDPFLSLYLVEDKKSFKHPFTINTHLALGTALINSDKAKEGKIIKPQLGLNTLANYSEKLFYPALLTNSCCSLEGIVTSKGIIEKEYIKRFLNTKNIDYSGIGIRVKDEKSFVVVTSVDPFMKENKFKIDDCILEFDNKKIKHSSIFMRKLLFSKLGTVHKIKVKRDNKIIELDVKTHKRYGGGHISDTYLEQKGIYLDKELNIVKIKSGYKSYGFKLGDKLLKVNDATVNNQRQVRENISNFDESASLLFQRNGFQFFVNMN